LTIRERIGADLKEAMKARDQVRLDTLRAALSGFTYRRVEAGRELTEEEELDVIRRLVKQRSDSIAEFAKAGRSELVEKETREREILQSYLPPQKSPDEIRAAVREIIASLPEGGRTQGAVMKVAMPRLRGTADGNVVRQIVTEELGS
jgi:uncharacterized protein YqeY